MHVPSYWAKAEHLESLPDHCVMMLLDGGLFSHEGEPILAAGDVVSPVTLARLAKSFAAPHGLQFMTITRP